MLLPQTNVDGATKSAEKIRQKCAERLIDDGKYAVRITVSIGVTSYKEKLHQTPGCMISFADEALYQAKEGGRNRVVIYQGRGSQREKEIIFGEKR
ncbi:diguanylate cyclase [Desulfobulbus sp. US1]|nr:diguanylate cyclase [Desulfobulbus sp. US1]